MAGSAAAMGVLQPASPPALLHDISVAGRQSRRGRRLKSARHHGCDHARVSDCVFDFVRVWLPDECGVDNHLHLTPAHVLTS
eukprot:365420-Chlamydomonas_euryale.AAC.16